MYNYCVWTCGKMLARIEYIDLIIKTNNFYVNFEMMKFDFGLTLRRKKKKSTEPMENDIISM